MKNFFRTASLSFFYRGLTLGSKFLLAIFIARFLSLADLGVYGIFTTTITLSIYLLGMDFYTYSVRNILAGDKSQRALLIREQLVFYGLNYLFFLPILLSVFLFNVLPWHYALFFYFILVFDHLSQEAYRLLVSLSFPLKANAVLFLRSGIWAYLIVALWLFDLTVFMKIESVLLFWSVGSALSVLLSLFFLRKYIFAIPLDIPLDMTYIKKGLLTALPFFAGTIAYKIIEFSDRYMIDFWLGKEEVGIYTFFAGISNLVEVSVHTTVIMIFSPQLIETFQKERGKFPSVFKPFRNYTALFTGIAAIGVCLIILPILQYLDKQELNNSLNTFFMLAAGKVMLNLSLIYHYVLYVSKNDRQIMWSTIAGAVLNVALNIWLIKTQGIFGAALATFISFMAILVLKFLLSRKVNG